MEIFKRRKKEKLGELGRNKRGCQEFLRQPHVAAAGLGSKPRETVVRFKWQHGKAFDANGSLDKQQHNKTLKARDL